MARSFTFDSLKGEYQTKYANMRTNTNKVNAVKAAATKINKGKDIYQTIEAKTNVPWYFIGMLHLRESDCNFRTHLHNGDSLQRRTVHVPAGRPPKGSPPFTFEASAIDALQYEGYVKITDWSIERIAYCSEQYNGWGYRYHNIPSAYLWAGTNQYKSGKYVRDGVFDPDAVDTQLGCMAVLKYLLENFVEDAPIVTSQVETPAESGGPLSPKSETDMPTNEAMNSVSTKHWWTDWLQWAGIGGAGTTVAYKTADTSGIEAIQPVVSNVKQIALAVGSIGVVVIFLGIIAYAIYMKYLMKRDVAEGRNIPSGGMPQ